MPDAPTARRRRRAALAAVLALAVGPVLAGCADLRAELDDEAAANRPGGADAAGERRAVAGPVRPPVTAPPAAPEEPAAPPPEEPPAAPATANPDDPAAPPCAGEDLAVRVAGFDVALGSRYLLLEATNSGAAPCAVQGRPDLAFRRASGTRTPNVTFEARAPEPARVVVTPGTRVRAELRWLGMSTSLDPDVTVLVTVRAVPGAAAVDLPLDEVALGDGTTLDWVDVLDGAEVHVGPWVPDVEGWA
ncbi:MAG: DUF4232 domain-containing protein [Actinomycetales bacterium]|nr:DUF4232 domain-containing protein [Actinomycetales bacterium]